MPQKVIPIDVKKRCCDLRNSGMSCRNIYDTYFSLQTEEHQLFESFARSLRRWMKKTFPSDVTLEKGTYDGFVAHDATVQVSADGEIVQAWIKQKVTDVDPELFIEAIKGIIEPYVYTPKNYQDACNMLELPLFDMHWGIVFIDYYKPVLNEILNLLNRQHWEKIVIPFGQDFFHNDSIVNGATTKGTIIEKVDMIRAVKDGKQFMYTIIDSAIENSNAVEIIYTPGNHDLSISWMFIQALLERYGSDIVDDSLKRRKVVTYGKNAVMITHGDSKRATPNNLAHIFPITFPEEFAKANVREVHSGHLHSEADTDVFGVMVRRLSSGNKTDDWTDKEDFVGTHKRFMVFNWDTDKLKAIYYI